MKRKVIFLDIDGTILNFDGTIPQSAKKAIAKAHELGHLLVLCSGRSRFQIEDSLMNLGFDGIVGGAGAFVEYKGEMIFQQFLELEQKKKLVQYLEEHKIIYRMQADHGMILNKRCQDGIIALFENIGIHKQFVKRLKEESIIREDVWSDPRIEKLLYYEAPYNIAQVQEAIGPYFSVTATSFAKPTEFSGEVGAANVHKATGMQCFLDHVGIEREDSIAIGDGPNDLEMLSYARVSVAMGNAQPYVKEKADMITKRIDEDGLYYAFEKLGLLEE